MACGIGTSIRTRELIRPESNGGKQCPQLEEKRTCQASKCSNRNLDKFSAHSGKNIINILKRGKVPQLCEACNNVIGTAKYIPVL